MDSPLPVLHDWISTSKNMVYLGGSYVKKKLKALPQGNSLRLVRPFHICNMSTGWFEIRPSSWIFKNDISPNIMPLTLLWATFQMSKMYEWKKQQSLFGNFSISSSSIVPVLEHFALIWPRNCPSLHSNDLDLDLLGHSTGPVTFQVTYQATFHQGLGVSSHSTV